MAILKNIAGALSLELFWYLNAPRKCRYSLMYAREVKEENQNVGPVLEIQKRLDVEFYIQNNNTNILKMSLHSFSKSNSLPDVLQQVFEKNPAFDKSLISQNDSRFGKHDLTDVTTLCYDFSIVYDEPGVLGHLLYCISKTGQQLTYQALRMSKLCQTLERDACKEILLKHGYYQEKAATIFLIEQDKLLAELLIEFNVGTKDVIFSCLKLSVM